MGFSDGEAGAMEGKKVIEQPWSCSVVKIERRLEEELTAWAIVDADPCRCGIEVVKRKRRGELCTVKEKRHRAWVNVDLGLRWDGWCSKLGRFGVKRKEEERMAAVERERWPEKRRRGMVIAQAGWADLNGVGVDRDRIGAVRKK
ncbi:hypothetical protein M0R45_034304 [Rubus argutus]|uniref:Uncharacterized protein n=1 Tax=Rubus argutus TaxID=59490 RepID=A0AAW1VSR6_RUBAR